MALHRLIGLAGLFLVATLASATQQPSTQETSSSPTVSSEFVKKRFGSEFTFMPSFAPLTADLDGDGVEDVVIAARCKNPLMDQAEHSYKVLDPYDSFYGFGDPKITTQFGAEDPQYRGLVLLIIHGAGTEAWRSETPKSKFVIINLPYKQLSVRKLMIRKKPVMAIYAEEASAGGATSVIFFDGKKYKYQPMGSSME
ncbi:MAG: hypothetical protein DMG72_09205 [Acidobacteria bacterium]|nr:MAG: hypothetical protein DMG72_09205 [Acidobacteriota bacterium]